MKYDKKGKKLVGFEKVKNSLAPDLHILRGHLEQHFPK